MRVLVVADGSRGDVQPMAVLASALQREGHAVTVVAPPGMRSLIEARTLRFVPLAHDVELMLHSEAAAVVSGMRVMLKAAPKLFIDSLNSQLQVLPELAKQHDFILAGGLHAGIATVAQYAGIPWRWVIFSSTLYPSSYHPPLTFPFGRAPRWVNYLAWQLTRLFTDRVLRRPINVGRKRLGLPRITDAAQNVLCANPILAMEPELAPIPPDWPELDVIGYLDPGEGDPLPAEIEAFLAAGPAPIYIGFGSMTDPDPKERTRWFAQAAERVGARLIVSRGWAGFGEGLPPHCLAIGPVSHPRLFARVAAIVHHGGAGTTAAATRAGKPQLVVPHIADQFHFGSTVHALGIAAPPLRRTRLTEDRLAERLDQLLHDASLRQRAHALGETLRARPVLANVSRLLVSHAEPAFELGPPTAVVRLLSEGPLSQPPR
jgi:UDP:flavonoid glycosyltransferase YjiC (YdhE family)